MMTTLLNDLEQKVRTMMTEKATLRLEISQLTNAIAHLEQHLAKYPKNPRDNHRCSAQHNAVSTLVSDQ